MGLRSSTNYTTQNCLLFIVNYLFRVCPITLNFQRLGAIVPAADRPTSILHWLGKERSFDPAEEKPTQRSCLVFAMIQLKIYISGSLRRGHHGLGAVAMVG